ncbi:M28 family peptidase [Polaribacter litorisediminis]|uniref:M20/M25/M40 family metallo-hydrolase n=1 Tax=Polaribacter litorisediminis TaxID=1908341 RepID=UPI001CBFD9D3|nr:M20/M25/M40 family metallo-hydrolase [Polaribacter litorisediminis]UAM96709.1 M28 family peptidase [Polaribacter litorisediminis]
MKLNLFTVAAFLLLLGSCKTHKPIEIDSDELLANIQILSDDSLEGRAFSTLGNQQAQQIILDEYTALGLEPVLGNNFLHGFSHTFKGKKRQDVFPIKNPKKDFSNVTDTIAKGANVIGMLKGPSDKSIVISAHFDHLGIIDGKIFNGADDNASGTAALFTIIKYFKNNPTKHNLIFAAFDAEEIGSLGADYFLKNYADKSNISLNINMDMIAHSEYDPELFACGLHHYPELRNPLEDVKSDKVLLLFGHDDSKNKEQADWTFSSDHRVFHREKIPFIYFGVPDHKDYHRATDTFETINKDFYIESVKVIIRAIENLDEYLAN